MVLIFAALTEHVVALSSPKTKRVSCRKSYQSMGCFSSRILFEVPTARISWTILKEKKGKNRTWFNVFELPQGHFCPLVNLVFLPCRTNKLKDIITINHQSAEIVNKEKHKSKKTTLGFATVMFAVTNRFTKIFCFICHGINITVANRSRQLPPLPTRTLSVAKAAAQVF